MRRGEARVRDGARCRREEDERERRAARDARARPGEGFDSRGFGRGLCRARRRGAGRGGDGRVRVRASARPRRGHLRASTPSIVTREARARGVLVGEARSAPPARAVSRTSRPHRRGQTSDDSNGSPSLVSSDTSETHPRPVAQPPSQEARRSECLPETSSRTRFDRDTVSLRSSGRRSSDVHQWRRRRAARRGRSSRCAPLHVSLRVYGGG